MNSLAATLDVPTDPAHSATGNALCAALHELRDAMQSASSALVHFDWQDTDRQFERQQQILRAIAPMLPANANLAAVAGLLREIAELNHLQSALVAGGVRAIQLEINLANFADGSSAH